MPCFYEGSCPPCCLCVVYPCFLVKVLDIKVVTEVVRDLERTQLTAEDLTVSR